MERVEIEHFYHDEFGRILASVIRLVGDFHIAEEAVQDAFAVALEQWPRNGRPANPRAWIISTARHKAIDVLRRLGRSSDAVQSYRRALALVTTEPERRFLQRRHVEVEG